MLLSALMEKTELGQFSILSFLLQKHEATMKAIMEETGFSKATVLKYIELLNERATDLNFLLQIEVVEDTVRLLIKEHVQGREIRTFFLENSLKYKILCHLLYKQTFSITSLARDMAISEATLNRHLLSLNQLLAEFSIAIHNGKLKGEEHQIRYFYYVLFRKVWLPQRLNEESVKVERLAEISCLESLCHSTMNQGQKMNLVIWCHISQQRLRVNGCRLDKIQSLMAPYADTIFFQRLLGKSATWLNSGRLHISLDISEMLLLFSFLLSERILPLHTMAYILGFGGPIAAFTTQLIQAMKQAGLFLDYIDEQVTYELSQLCAQGYLFKGYLLQDSYKYNTRVRLPYLFSHNEYLPLAKKMSQELAIFHQGTDLDRKLLWELLEVLDFIVENKHKKMTIGLDLLGGQFTLHRMKTTLLRFLEYNQFIQVEAFTKEKTFDLVISNNPMCQAEQAAIYHLKSDLNQQDLQNIRDMISF